jgi:hypothetical protein
MLRSWVSLVGQQQKFAADQADLSFGPEADMTSLQFYEFGAWMRLGRQMDL